MKIIVILDPNDGRVSETAGGIKNLLYRPNDEGYLLFTRPLYRKHGGGRFLDLRGIPIIECEDETFHVGEYVVRKAKTRKTRRRGKK